MFLISDKVVGIAAVIVAAVILVIVIICGIISACSKKKSDTVEAKECVTPDVEEQVEDEEETRNVASGIDLDADGEIEVNESEEKKRVNYIKR